MLKVDNNTYIFSDPHYGHRNIVAGETSWFYDENLREDEIKAIRKKHCRNFDTRKEMNQTIVSNINEKVPENATLICLGDWSFGGKENIWDFRKQINCKDIHLILGNHDHHIEKNKRLPNCHKNGMFGEDILDGGYDREFEHAGDDNKSVYAQELFSSVSHYKEMRFKRNGHTYHFVLSHYAMRVWNKSHHGSIMLYGHSHGTLDADGKYGNTCDVGLDTNNFYPYHIEEIIDKFD